MVDRGMNQRQHAAHRKTLKRNVRGEHVPGERGITLQETTAFKRAQGIHDGIQDAESRPERRGMTRDELRQNRKQRGQQRRT